MGVAHGMGRGGKPVKIGDINSYRKTPSIGAGYLPCDGSIKSSADYPKLAEVLDSYVPQEFEKVTMDTTHCVYFPKIKKYVKILLESSLTTPTKISVSPDLKQWTQVATITFRDYNNGVALRYDPALDEVGFVIKYSYNGYQLWTSNNATNWVAGYNYVGQGAADSMRISTLSYLKGKMTFLLETGFLKIGKTSAEFTYTGGQSTPSEYEMAESASHTYRKVSGLLHKCEPGERTGTPIYTAPAGISILSIMYDNGTLIAVTARNSDWLKFFVVYSTDDVNFTEIEVPKAIWSNVEAAKYVSGKWYFMVRKDSLNVSLYVCDDIASAALVTPVGFSVSSPSQQLTGGDTTLAVVPFQVLNIDTTRFTIPKVSIENYKSYIKAK